MPHSSPGSDAHPGWVDLPVLASSRPARRYPPWIKVRYSENSRYLDLLERVRHHSLHTVCQEAECPNIGECWAHGTATFMLLGETCTRSCKFCAVERGKPGPLDPREPESVAAVVADLGLEYSVLTSVDRDDLPDEGADHFALTIEAIVRMTPTCRVEALVPDFHAREDCIRRVVETPLFVFAHNVETVPRLYRDVRTGSVYERSLETLRRAKDVAADSPRRAPSTPDTAILTKSSLMLGLGETTDELLAVFDDLRSAGVDILTLGQYLQPTPAHARVERFVPPEEFDALRQEAESRGFRHVVSSPMSRSSYHAWEAADEAAER